MKTINTQRLTKTRLVGTKLRDSLFGLLRRPADIEGDIDGIRRAMLSALGDDKGAESTQLERQILFAPDIEALWFTRSTLMHVLATSRGESHARSELAGITRMFPSSGPLFRQHRTGIRHH